jgi:esterase
MSYREMYEDVIKLANHLKCDNFHLLGHSMGGKVAMQLALAHVSRIKSLIIVDIAPKPYPLWHQKTLQGILSAPVKTFKTRQQADQYLTPWIEDTAERTFILKNLKRNNRDDSFQWRCNLSEISKGYLKIAGFSSALQTYPEKTLFIKGENSNYILESDLPLIQSLFPQASLESIANSGHLPHFQEADYFFHLVNNFLL